MENYRVIEIKQSVFADNDQDANRLRQELKENKTFLLNLMSSPGSGKTTTLKQTISRMKNKYRMAVMEADIDSTWTLRLLRIRGSGRFSSTPAACVTLTPT